MVAGLWGEIKQSPQSIILNISVTSKPNGKDLSSANCVDAFLIALGPNLAPGLLVVAAS